MMFSCIISEITLARANIKPLLSLILNNYEEVFFEVEWVFQHEIKAIFPAFINYLSSYGWILGGI